MLNLTRPDVRVFIEYFKSEPALCRTVLDWIDDMFYDGMNTATFYLHPAKEFVKRKFYIRIKRTSGRRNVWSAIVVENGKDILGSYRNVMNEKQTLRAILEILETEKEGDTHGC